MRSAARALLSSMLSLDELRQALGRPDMPDAEAEALRDDLYSWLNSFLDAYFESAARTSRSEENRTERR